MMRVVIERPSNGIAHPDTPATEPDPVDRPPQTRRTAPEVPRRRPGRKVHGRCCSTRPTTTDRRNARTNLGSRVTEFCELTHDAIVRLNETNWLRLAGRANFTPTATCHCTRRSSNSTPTWREPGLGPDDTGRLISNQGRVLNRFSVSRTVAACARIAGIGHVHPHQLRHTLATQSINNGMSLEAVEAYVWTPIHAHDPRLRIADRTVADEYFAAANKVDQLYQSHLTTSPA